MTRRNAALTIVSDTKHRATVCILTNRSETSIEIARSLRASVVRARMHTRVRPQYKKNALRFSLTRGLIYRRSLIEKHRNVLLENSRIGKPCYRRKCTAHTFSYNFDPEALTLFRNDRTFCRFWRRANFVGEINARFTRCYENRIYVFVNPPLSCRYYAPFGAIFHRRARSATFSPRFLSR